MIVSTPEHMHFAGFKAGKTPQLHMTYLMWKSGSGFRIGTSRTYTNGQIESLAGPAIRLNGEHADAAWVFAMHEAEAEAASETLHVSSLRAPDAAVCRPAEPGDERRTASLPTRRCSTGSSRDRHESGGRSCSRTTASASGTRISQRHDRPNGARVRRRLTVTLCGDPTRPARRMHRISLFGYDEEGRRALEAIGLSLRPADKGSAAGVSRRQSRSRPDRRDRRADPGRPRSLRPVHGAARRRTTVSARSTTRSPSCPLRRPARDGHVRRTNGEFDVVVERRARRHRRAGLRPRRREARTTSSPTGSSRTTRSTPSAAPTSATSSSSSATSRTRR